MALISPRAGSLTSGWSRLLLSLSGWAAYITPAAIGASPYMHARGRPASPTRLPGAALLLLSALAATHLALRLPNPFLLSVAGFGGGWLGWADSFV